MNHFSPDIKLNIIDTAALPLAGGGGTAAEDGGASGSSFVSIRPLLRFNHPTTRCLTERKAEAALSPCKWRLTVRETGKSVWGLGVGAG